MIKALLAVLGAGISLWVDGRKAKFHEQYVKLRGEWYEEYNKPLDQRDDAKLDIIERKLRVLCQEFAAGVGSKDA
jgi:hypothetical protein